MFTDIHTHILPAMDDGTENLAEALDLLRYLEGEGIERLWLTPHYYASRENVEVFIQRRRESFEKLRPYLDEFNISFRLGAEVYIMSELLEFSDIERLCASETNYLLLEIPYDVPSGIFLVEMIKEISARYSVDIILAHIERYENMIPSSLLERILDLDVEFQLNLSFMNRSQREKHKWLSYLENGKIRFLGTDAHNMHRRKPIVRKNWQELQQHLAHEIIKEIY
ncbi:MAG: hypothetical protein PHR78_04915 [Eubacteriales bacterium]|nr:hypothetical protein [Eubacteriales bacterium]MDD4541482.1 hypothetical protein [Eubacteriales bacterium]